MSSDDSLSLDEDNTIENVYQKKTQLEHILLRPDSYVGSIKNEEKVMWIYDFEKSTMVEKKITYNPALYKIFDEILVNASDNKIRDPKMSAIRIDIDKEKNMIRIWNNGKGIPVVMHKDVNVYVPTMIFGQLLTSTNFNDNKKQVTGGRNGYGAKLCNIFSVEFMLETSCKEYGKSFKQVWSGNMNTATDPIIGNCHKEDFTCVTFYPDLKRFGMTHLDDNIIALFSRRAFDVAACTNGISVHLNGQSVPVKNFKDYVELYTKSSTDSGEEMKVVYEKYGDRWEVAMTTSTNDNFTQVSFVNSIATTKGGTHVNYITEQAAAKLLEIAKKKLKNDKQAVKLKTTQVKNNMWVFVKCLIENPSFDSQTKENMTLNSKDFGSTCLLSDKFITQVSKCGILEKVMMWAMFKNQALLDKKCNKTKQSRLKDISKLDDANLAGTKNSMKCRLFLTEGDSAKTLAVAGVGAVEHGKDFIGVFPLKGKLLNVREASTKQLSENTEITNLIKILGLQYQQKYESEDSIKTLRYGKLVLMTDQDHDGSHIKGLAINFIHAKWPNLLKHNFIEQFITPIVKVFKGGNEISFYSIPEFREWERSTPNADKWRTKYYKGLGTSTSKEAKEYFTDMTRHLIPFKYGGEDCGKSIVMAFSKDKADDRKDWLTTNMEETKRRRELGLEEDYLYKKNTRVIQFDDFINKELVLFSNTDNQRSIPCMVDGFKPGQRKVLFACFKRNLMKEIKVAQLAGSVAELSAYHHGEASLMSTIVNLAQDYVGSNNINLLMPIGQFGTRLQGGKDSASARYIFTQLNTITRLIFHPQDDPVLKYLYDDNQRIEPEWYAPIIPMVLVNGCDGIGTGWSSKIPNFNPKEIIANVRRVLNGQEPIKMHPWFRGFRGEIREICENKYQVSGEIGLLGETALEITELPLRTWTTPYKEGVIELLRNGTDKCPASITDYKDFSTDSTVRFVIEMSREKKAEAEAMGYHKFFKVQSSLTLNNMILFDECGVIKRYNSAEDILKSFCTVRLSIYKDRKNYLVGLLSAEAKKLENQARFILEKIKREIIVENIKTAKLMEILIDRKYDSDPMKAWKVSMESVLSLEKEEPEENGDVLDANKPDFTYLINMRIVDLTEEKKEELLKKRDDKIKELKTVREKTLEEVWLEDLKALENQLDILYNQEKLPTDSSNGLSEIPVKKTTKKGGKAVKLAADTAPSKFAIRVEPKLEEEYVKKMTIDAEKKKKQTGSKKQKQMMEEHFGSKDNGDTLDCSEKDELSLTERLAAKGNFAAKDLLKQKRKNSIKEINPAKESKKKSASPSKKRKKEIWDSDSDENADDDMLSDAYKETDYVSRDFGLKRNAAKNVNYNLADDEEEDSISKSSNDDKDVFDPEMEGLKPVIPVSNIGDPISKSKPVKRKSNETKPKKAKIPQNIEKKIVKPKASKPSKPVDLTKSSSNSNDANDVDNIFKADPSENSHDFVESRARRQIAKKVYVMDDDGDEDGGSDFEEQSDSDFDYNAEIAKSKKRKKNFLIV